MGKTGPRGVPISDLEVHDVDDSSARARVVVLFLQIGQAHCFSSPTRQKSQHRVGAEILTTRRRGLGQLPSCSSGCGAPSLLNPMPYRIGAAAATGLVILSLYWM